MVLLCLYQSPTMSQMSWCISLLSAELTFRRVVVTRQRRVDQLVPAVAQAASLADITSTAQAAAQLAHADLVRPFVPTCSLSYHSPAQEVHKTALAMTLTYQLCWSCEVGRTCFRSIHKWIRDNKLLGLQATSTVMEMTALAGTVGRHLAAASGASPEIADAVGILSDERNGCVDVIGPYPLSDHILSISH